MTQIPTNSTAGGLTVYKFGLVRRFIAICCFALIAATGVFAQTSQVENSSIQSILNSDGTIKNDRAGNFDPRGFQMTTDAEGKPRFVASDSIESPKQNDALAVAACSDNWDGRFSNRGIVGSINAVAVDSSGNIYIGGSFVNIGDLVVNYVAKWNGTNWEALGGGTNYDVSSIAVYNDKVYIAGGFSTAGGVTVKGVAVWDGSTWSPLGAGFSGTFNGIAVNPSNGYVYVAGSFDPFNGAPGKNIAKWDGTNWSALNNSASNSTDGTINGIAVSGNNVYAVGSFSKIGGVTANRAAKWDGAAWSAMGSGFDSTVRAVGVDSNGVVYVGGDFFNAGFNSANRVARWNGVGWSPLITGSSNGVTGGNVSTIATFGTDVYFGGNFTTYSSNFGGVSVKRLVRWNGSSFSTVGSGSENGVSYSSNVGGSVSGIAVNGTGEVVVVGGFNKAGTTDAINIGKWNGTSWGSFDSGQDNGISGTVNSIVVDVSGNVYVGGNFTKAGTLAANNISKWDGTAWSTLGSGAANGLNGEVKSIVLDGNDLYVSGNFSTAGGASAMRIAKWNGTTWETLGGGLNQVPYSLAVIGDEVFAAGFFTTVNNMTVNNIVRYNKTTGIWSAVGGGVTEGYLNKIVASGTDLYVAGSFYKANGINVRNVAKWDTLTSTWSALANGTNNGPDSVVLAIAASGNTVYVGGNFSTMGGYNIPVNNIAKWDGTAWSTLGSGASNGVDSFVHAIAVNGTDVYVGGRFTKAGGVDNKHVAKWNGISWSGFNGGVHKTIGGTNYGWVYAAAARGSDIYFGGDFITAGCRPSYKFGHYYSQAWTGGTNNDWHTATNWNTNQVPIDNQSVMIPQTGGDLTISVADVNVFDLQLGAGQTLTIEPGRTLTVNGALSLAGKIEGGGSLVITSCHTAAITGASASGYVKTKLTRCINNTGNFTFPVGTDNGYSPVRFSNVAGNGNFTVKANQTAHPNANLPVNRLARFWNLTNNGGITQTDVQFSYLPGDITAGTENGYKIFRLEDNGTVTNFGGTINAVNHTATVTGVTGFSDWTLAEQTGPTAASVNVAGRVLDSNGFGVRRAMVSLMSPNGEIRTVLTNQLGYYRFEDVAAGATYIFEVSSKRHTFAPQVVNVTEDINNLNLIALP